MAKQKKPVETEAAATAPPSTDAPENMVRLQADLDNANKRVAKSIEASLKRGEEAAAARAKFEAGLREKAAAENRKNRQARIIPVIVQRAKNRDVRLHGGKVLKSLRWIKVNREELRRLQGLRKSGHIQLIVGEIKQGKVQDKAKKEV